MAKNRPKNATLQLDIRDERIPEMCRLYLMGRTQFEIGERLKVSREVVSRTMSYMRQVWVAKADKAIDRLFAEQLQKIDLVESQAWQEWERSKSTRRIRSIKRGPDGKPLEKMMRYEEQYGDPRFLTVIQQCIRDRNTLLGLDKRNENGATVQGVDIVEVVVDTPEQAAELMHYEQFNAGRIGASKVTTIEARDVAPESDGA